MQAPPPRAPEPCKRVSEALAAGNVWGDAALLEHAKSCEVCTSELAVLKKRREFRDAFPVLSSIADEAKRPSARMRTGDDDARMRASRRHLFVMTAAVIAIGTYFFEHRVSPNLSAPAKDDENGESGPPRYRISNLANAVFESKVEGGTVHASMTRGVAAFYIEHLNQQQRFLLTLPDGDLEVRGTRFVVSIEGGKTDVVDVAQGVVALRLRGHDEMVLSAGERWPREGSGRPSVSFMHLAPKNAAGPDASKPGD